MANLLAPETLFAAETRLYCSYWPGLTAGVVIVIGRLNSITSSVPAGSVADRCLPSQWLTVMVAPTAPPMSKPLPPPLIRRSAFRRRCPCRFR